MAMTSERQTLCVAGGTGVACVPLPPLSLPLSDAAYRYLVGAVS